MAAIKLTEHLGTEIFVDTDNGKFSARLSNGYQVEERVLSTLKRAIEKDEPCVRVMRVQKRYASARPDTLTRSRLSSLAVQQRLNSDEDILDEYAELDEGVIQRLKEIDGAETVEVKSVHDKYEALGREVIDAVPPITVGRVKELLAEDAKAKAVRR